MGAFDSARPWGRTVRRRSPRRRCQNNMTDSSTPFARHVVLVFRLALLSVRSVDSAASFVAALCSDDYFRQGAAGTTGARWFTPADPAISSSYSGPDRILKSSHLSWYGVAAAAVSDFLSQTSCLLNLGSLVLSSQVEPASSRRPPSRPLASSPKVLICCPESPWRIPGSKDQAADRALPIRPRVRPDSL